jgi:NAD(P)-dependent dehydrogenase (short-subunit alcohol dehydrogenase family)
MALEWALEAKPIIVTGASSGIGAETARELGALGARIAVVGRDNARLGAVASDVEANGGTVHQIFADLADPGSPGMIVDQTLEAFDGIYGIVHAASLFDPQPLETTTIETIENQMRSNVTAPLLMTKAAVPHLGEGSSIVFVSSTVASVGFPGCSAYTATKGATNGIALALAVELAPLGIRVNAVVPGYVRTPMLQPHLDAIDGYETWIQTNTPQNRIAGPEELATSIVYLLSPLSGYVHGAQLVADGGWIAR